MTRREIWEFCRNWKSRKKTKIINTKLRMVAVHLTCTVESVVTPEERNYTLTSKYQNSRQEQWQREFLLGVVSTGRGQAGRGLSRERRANRTRYWVMDTLLWVGPDWGGGMEGLERVNYSIDRWPWSRGIVSVSQVILEASRGGLPPKLRSTTRKFLEATIFQVSDLRSRGRVGGGECLFWEWAHITPNHLFGIRIIL